MKGEIIVGGLFDMDEVTIKVSYNKEQGYLSFKFWDEYGNEHELVVSDVGEFEKYIRLVLKEE